MSKSVLLYSGGMDSYAANLLYAPDVLVYVDAGTRYSAVEMQRLPRGTEIVEMHALNTFLAVDDVIPLRNLFFVAVAAQYGDNIILGATKQDFRLHDKSERFAADASDLMSYLLAKQFWTEGRTIQVQLPMKHMNKPAIIEAVHAKCGDAGVQALADTWSCYTPNGNDVCGTCKPCRRKWIAFAATGYAHMVKDCRAEVVKHEYGQILRNELAGSWVEQEVATVQLAMQRTE